MIAAYPLQWPTGWPRIPASSRKSAAFMKREAPQLDRSWGRKLDLTVSDGVERVLGELSRMGVDRQDVVISTNVRTRLDGLPRSSEPKPEDPGAAVYWIDIRNSKSARRVMAIDRYREVADNLAAIAATLEAMRAIERHGGAQILDRAFTGFIALPNPDAKRTWREVLDYGNGEARAKDIDQHYRLLAREAHPDRGGTNERMAELNAARDEGLREARA